jgi:nucleotide-binding universal stress UspA family protein
MTDKFQADGHAIGRVATSLTESSVKPLPATGDPELNARAGRQSNIRTVLLATDLSPVSEAATQHAIDMAAGLGARLLVVNVIDPGDRSDGHAWPLAQPARVDQQRAGREGPLMAIMDRARSRGVEAAFLLWTGEPGHSIVAAAEAEGADLIIVGTRGLDRAGRFLLGSVSDYVVYHSGCPVLVAR